MLMEAAPEGVDVQEIGTAMAAVEGVREGTTCTVDGHLGLPRALPRTCGWPGARPRRGPPRGGHV